ncbi:unnamed protein product [Rhodiola kirilowii]
MEDYRPISLISVVSKTVSKVIVNRLQQILPDIISPAQSAFIKGRLITDNYLIAHETSHFIKNQRYGRKCYGLLKLDMSKAYDRVEWRYLKLLLLRFGFDKQWVSMVLKYVSSLDEVTAETVSNFLKNYENISGQIINYHKSELVLSPNVTDPVKSYFQTMLSVKIVSHHDKYLGLPLTLKRKLTINFSGIIDKFCSKTEGWHAKNLSVGGKEVLIKAVLQALPQYAMNCFKLPDHIIKKMHSSIRKFWWSCSSKRKPIYWVSAQTLCQDKDMGGLGFKDLEYINLAFLAKQAWRIYTQPELLLSRLYKAKYCHSSDMLFCSVGYRPSFCWRSIMKGFEVIRKGSVQDQNGIIRWTANSSGIFELKSAYKLMMQIQGSADRQGIGCSDYSQNQRFWKEYWRLAVPRKVKFFGWRGFHAALPTCTSLQKRGLTNNISCIVCGYKVESYSHLFLHCWFARATWDQLGFPELSNLPAAASFADMIHFCWRHFSRRKRQLILVSLWLIWYNRNKLKHGDNAFSLNELVFKAKNLSRCFEQYVSKPLSSMRFLYTSEFEWRKPPVGFLKINCDASWKQGRGGGIGVVVRDNCCNILAVRASRNPDLLSSVFCESLGLLESFKLAVQLKANRVIFEMDCADVVKWINICPNAIVAQEDWFQEALAILHRHMEWKIVLIRREANIGADRLAKHALDQNWCWTRLDCCPRLNFLSS